MVREKRGIIKNKSGIYCIENLKNGKKYIGQSIDLERRKYEHFSSLKGNHHSNIHLQNAFNKYGENNFKFRVLLYCKSSELTKYEQFFVDYYTPKTLYNICLECVDSNQGITLSKEANSGENNPMWGRHHSKEAIRKMSEAKHGKNNPMYGKHFSEETKKKMSEIHCGKNNPMYGKHFSEETKRKMSKNHLDVSGIKSPNSKFTKYEIFDILNLYYNENKKITTIAKKYYFVSKSTIHRICHGERYKPCYNHFIKNKGAI